MVVTSGGENQRVGAIDYRESMYQLLQQMQQEGSENETLQALSLKGWQVDAKAFRELKEIGLYTIPLRPYQPPDDYWPWSDGAKAQRQLHRWQEQLGGDVVYLIISEKSEIGKIEKKAYPVKKAWIDGMGIDELFDQYTAFKDRPEGVMYRAAIIARTGEPPVQSAQQ